MSNPSVYESRTGTLSCTSAEVYNFVTDIRNFERFIQNGTINNWQAERDACSFSVSAVGTITIRITGKEPFRRVIFIGDALKKNDFSLFLDIDSIRGDTAEVKLLLEAELNPILKMMADKPIIQFLEMLIIEMENFRNWKDVIK